VHIRRIHLLLLLDPVQSKFLLPQLAIAPRIQKKCLSPPKRHEHHSILIENICKRPVFVYYGLGCRTGCGRKFVMPRRVVIQGLSHGVQISDCHLIFESHVQKFPEFGVGVAIDEVQHSRDVNLRRRTEQRHHGKERIFWNVFEHLALDAFLKHEYETPLRIRPVKLKIHAGFGSHWILSKSRDLRLKQLAYLGIQAN